MYFAVEFRDELLKKQKLLLNLTTSPKCVVHYGTLRNFNIWLLRHSYLIKSVRNHSFSFNNN